MATKRMCDEPVKKKTEQIEAVNHPKHYSSSRFEVIDIIEDFVGFKGVVAFDIGNVIKYVLRAGKKTSDPIEDLKKAQWYLNHAIDELSLLDEE